MKFENLVSLKPHENDREVLIHNLKLLMEEFCRNLKQEGIPVLPFQGDDLNEVKKLETDQIQKIYEVFTQYFNIYVSAGSKNIDMKHDKEILWLAIQKLGLRPCSDLMDKIEDGDIIEIYNRDSVQLFRNLNFFQICSYSLDDLFTGSWPELYYRREAELKELGAVAMKLLSGGVKNTIEIEVGEHELLELRSVCNYVIKARFKYLSPLYSQVNKNQIEGYVVTSSARVIESRKILQGPGSNVEILRQPAG